MVIAAHLLVNQASVPDLKRNLEALTDIPVASQRLIYLGKVLKDDQTLSSYGVFNQQNVASPSHALQASKTGELSIW